MSYHKGWKNKEVSKTGNEDVDWKTIDLSIVNKHIVLLKENAMPCC